MIKINNEKLDQTITSKLLTLSKYFTCSLIATFYFAHVEHFWTFFKHALITSYLFQQVDVYLNEPIKIDEKIKLASQLIQKCTRDGNGKVIKKEIKKEEKNVMFWSLKKHLKE